MSSDLITIFYLNKGIISRYVKPLFISSELTISPVLFDLRDGAPPEKFVSFYKVDEANEDTNFISAKGYLKITTKPNGAIVLLDIEESLQNVNDEEEEIITFKEQNLPHCGLIYLTNNLTKIQEAKTTLSYLAADRFRLIKDIDMQNSLRIQNLLSSL